MKKLKKFDFTNEYHMHRYRQFLIHNKWGTGGCPFELEYPYTSIPDMIKDKIVRRFMGVA